MPGVGSLRWACTFHVSGDANSNQRKPVFRWNMGFNIPNGIKMECFIENFKYHYWILHKKLVLDEIFRISQKSTHISLNIGLRIFKSHIPEHPFPLAGHNYYGQHDSFVNNRIYKGWKMFREVCFNLYGRIDGSTCLISKHVNGTIMIHNPILTVVGVWMGGSPRHMSSLRNGDVPSVTNEKTCR